MPVVEDVLVEIRLDIRGKDGLTGTGPAGFVGRMTVMANHTASISDIEKRVKELFEGSLTDKAKFRIMKIERDVKK
jgi:hypothetical protein